MDKQHVQDAFQKHVFFPIIIEGPWIHQSGPATVSSGQFRVRVVHTSHHSITVHREPEQQLHITSSLSSTPHNQPQHAVVKFQWMVRVNIFDKKKNEERKNARKKTAAFKKKKKERDCLESKTLSSQPVKHGLRKHGRPKRSIKGCL